MILAEHPFRNLPRVRAGAVLAISARWTAKLLGIKLQEECRDLGSVSAVLSRSAISTVLPGRAGLAGKLVRITRQHFQDDSIEIELCNHAIFAGRSVLAGEPGSTIFAVLSRSTIFTVLSRSAISSVLPEPA